MFPETCRIHGRKGAGPISLPGPVGTERGLVKCPVNSIFKYLWGVCVCVCVCMCACITAYPTKDLSDVQDLVENE